jgi:thiamine-phosphate pyrophosphorylase
MPEHWLFTDERIGAALWAAIAQLPRRSGIVVRHYRSADRGQLAARLARLARRGGHMLVVAGDARLARRVGAAGMHLPTSGPLRPALTAAAHDRAGIVRARRAGAALAFVSPLFATRSHPGRRPLGRVRFGLLARGAGVAVAALGGMTPQRFGALRPLGARGWGAIDYWLDAQRDDRRQKRIAVPR